MASAQNTRSLPNGTTPSSAPLSWSYRSTAARFEVIWSSNCRRSGGSSLEDATHRLLWVQWLPGLPKHRKAHRIAVFHREKHRRPLWWREDLNRKRARRVKSHYEYYRVDDSYIIPWRKLKHRSSIHTSSEGRSSENGLLPWPGCTDPRVV
jgi:hypothetical protein